MSERYFGECAYCDKQVTFPGWDEVCDDCLDEIRAEDDAEAERLREEDHFLYGGGAA